MGPWEKPFLLLMTCWPRSWIVKMHWLCCLKKVFHSSIAKSYPRKFLELEEINHVQVLAYSAPGFLGVSSSGDRVSFHLYILTL